MKKIGLIGWLLLGAVTTIAQSTPSSGLILDEVAYEKTPQTATFDFFGSRYGEIPLEYSLKTYCPEPNFQNGIQNCVFQSLSYAAMTIMFAAQNNITDKSSINKIRFSALYGFNQLTAKCTGIPFLPALEFLKNHGTVSFADFDALSETDCLKKPSDALIRKAATCKIKDYARVLHRKDDLSQKIRKVKQCIATNTPVIAAMQLPSSFITYKGQKTYYEDKSMTAIAHSMVVVGYDEYSFELMNSYGKHWGKEGYVKIKYADFFYYLKEAYQIAFDKPADKPTEWVSLKGHFEFRTPQTGAMEAMPFELKAGRYYQSVEKTKLNQQFQLAVIDLQKNKYVYVLGYDPNGKTNLHWPQVGGQQEYGLRESALTPYETVSFVMPSLKQAFTKDKVGTDYLFILYSDKALNISDLENRLKAMETSTEKYVVLKFETAFKGLLLDWDKIQYDAQKVGFSAPITDAVVPLILQLRGNEGRN
jgi:Papain family cysteine protease